MNSIAAEWAKFSRNAVPGSYSEERLEMMRQIFYAGAIAGLSIITRASQMTAAESEAVALAVQEEASFYVAHEYGRMPQTCPATASVH